MKKTKSRAFTVAEVLITLLVLGILVTMTMPSIMFSHEKNVIQANFADIYKETNKAIFNYTVKNNCQGKLSCTNIFNESDDNAAEQLAGEFRAIKAGKNCWAGKGDENGEINLDDFSCFVDGKNRIFATQSVDGTCSTDKLGTKLNENDEEVKILKKHKLEKTCGYLYVDINGEKAPNIFGRDLFMFIVTDAASSYLYPNGGNLVKEDSTDKLDNWTEANCNSSGGITCAGRIVEEGMKVKYLK